MSYRTWPWVFVLCIALSAHAEFPPETFPPDDQAPPAAEPDEPSESETPSPYLKPKNRRTPEPVARPRRARQPIARERPPTVFPEWNARATILLGYGILSEGNATNDNWLSTYAMRDHFIAGVSGSGYLGKHFGGELEFALGTTPLNEVAIANVVQSTHQFKHSSLIVGLRGAYPFEAGSAVVTPYLVVGFGMGKVSEAYNTVSPASNEAYELSLSGFFVGAGLSADLGEFLHLFADYGMAIGTSGSFDVNGSITSAPSPSLTRLRLGGDIQIWGPLRIGPLLVMRSFGANATGTSNVHIGKGDNVLQLLGNVIASF